MKISAQEEYGIRCLLQIGRRGAEASLTIPEISREAGLSEHYTAKLLRVLRRGGLVKSARGQAGGYMLSRPPERINIGEALAVLGGRLYEAGFCEHHVGAGPVCVNSIDCSIRCLWRTLQGAVDRVLSRTTLQDLLSHENEAQFPAAGLVSSLPAAPNN